MVFAHLHPKIKRILIINQEAEVRPNQSEVAFRVAIEDLSNEKEDFVVTTLNYMHTNPRFIERGEDVYLEADGSEVNISKVQLVTQDEKFMKLVNKRMHDDRVNNLAYGMKIEQRGDDIYLVYPPLHHKVSDFDGMILMSWGKDDEQAFAIQAKVEQCGVVPLNSLKTSREPPSENPHRGLAESNSKIIAHKLFTEHGVPTPETLYFLSNTYDEKSIKNALRNFSAPPWFIKAEHGVGGTSVWRVGTENARGQSIDEVLAITHSLKAAGDGFIIQKAIPSPAGNRPQRTRIIVQDGKVTGGLLWTGAAGSVTDNAFENKDEASIVLHSVPVSCLAELTEVQKDAAIKATKAVGLWYGGVDLVGTPENPLVLEANHAPGIWCHKMVGQGTVEELAAGMLAKIDREQRKHL